MWAVTARRLGRRGRRRDHLPDRGDQHRQHVDQRRGGDRPADPGPERYRPDRPGGVGQPPTPFWTSARPGPTPAPTPSSRPTSTTTASTRVQPTTMATSTTPPPSPATNCPTEDDEEEPILRPGAYTHRQDRHRRGRRRPAGYGRCGRRRDQIPDRGHQRRQRRPDRRRGQRPAARGRQRCLGLPAGESATPTRLDVGETWTYTGTYTVQQADLDATASTNGGDDDGDIDNTATVSSDELPDEERRRGVADHCDPAYSIVKTVTDVGGDGPLGIGRRGRRRHRIPDRGDQHRQRRPHRRGVSDPLLEGANGSADRPASRRPPTSLDVGETWTYTGTYTVQQADLDATASTRTAAATTMATSTTPPPSPATNCPTRKTSEDVPIAATRPTIVKTVTDVGGDGPLGCGRCGRRRDQLPDRGRPTPATSTRPASWSPTRCWAHSTAHRPASGDADVAGCRRDLDLHRHLHRSPRPTWTTTASTYGVADDDGDIDNTATVSSDELPDPSKTARSADRL